MKGYEKRINDRLHFVFVFFFAAATLMLLVTVLVSIFINRMEKKVVESVQNHLIAAAQAASTFLTVQELELFHTARDMEKPEWEFIRSRLRQFAIEHRVLYVSYWRYMDGQTQYIIDNDEDEESMVTPELFTNIYEDEVTAESVSAIMAGGPWISDLGTYSGSWYELITGIAPVFNADGSVYGGAEVDLSDEIILAQQHNIRVMRIMLVFSIILSLLSGFFGMRVYHKKAIQSESANRAKSTFLSTMSNEIRTPVNAILGVAQIELQKGDLPSEYTETFERIYQSGNSLLEIINDALDLSKIEAGKMELNPIEYDIPNLIHDSMQLNIVRIGSKPIELLLDIEGRHPSKLIGDEIRIKQIVNNLLSNAIVYTDKGHIKLTVRHLTEASAVTLCLTVEDTGQGFMPEDLEKLFSVNHVSGGTGLGLNITKRLVELMGGTIKTESTYGKGSIFTVTVKQKAAECEPIGENLAQQLRGFTFTGTKQRARQKIVREPMPYGKVLVVDDMEVNLYVAQGLMSKYNMQIDTANSGFAAIEKVESGNTYDVIFMDHIMPLMDGAETTQKLRTLGYNGVIMALTASALLEEEKMFKQYGFDDFIPKPVDLKLLNVALNKYFRDRHPEEAKKYKILAKEGL